MHYGAAREIHFSPPHDVNHYDTVHAEVELILQASRQKIGLKDTSFFINTLPCPMCARMLSQTDIKELVYQNDHSEGYAIKMLEACGKIVRRLVL
jgi:deoxycytidylate deaminase